MSLTQNQQVELERILEQRAGELEQQIRNTLPKPADETTLERTGVAQDEVDEATTNAEEHFNHTLHRHYVGEMVQLEAVRERARAGLADRCADCGEDIGFPRLLVQPLAVRCIECQARHEHLQGFVRRATP